MTPSSPRRSGLNATDFLDVLSKISPLSSSDRLRWRKDLAAANLSGDQYEKITRNVATMSPPTRQEMKDLLVRQTPFPLLVEYLSAADYPSDGTPSRRSIASREIKRSQDPVVLSPSEVVTRASYIGAYSIFSAALPLAVARIASLTHLSEYVRPVNELADWVSSGIMSWATRLGVLEGDLVQFAGDSGPLLLSGLLASAAGASWSRRRLASDGLSEKIAQPSLGLAEELFGFKGWQQLKKSLTNISRMVNF